MVLGPNFRKVLPYINFVVATSALSFQYFVLYPWHKELDKDFHQLKNEQNLTLQEYHKLKLQRLDEIENNILKLEATNSKIADAQQKLVGNQFFN